MQRLLRHLVLSGLRALPGSPPHEAPETRTYWMRWYVEVDAISGSAASSHPCRS